MWNWNMTKPVMAFLILGFSFSFEVDKKKKMHKSLRLLTNVDTGDSFLTPPPNWFV